jgi:hypothetical protein
MDIGRIIPLTWQLDLEVEPLFVLGRFGVFEGGQELGNTAETVAVIDEKLDSFRTGHIGRKTVADIGKMVPAKLLKFRLIEGVDDEQAYENRVKYHCELLKEYGLSPA